MNKKRVSDIDRKVFNNLLRASRFNNLQRAPRINAKGLKSFSNAKLRKITVDIMNERITRRGYYA